MEEEAQTKRVRGLCYRYDGKWQVGHKCRHLELHVVIIFEPNAKDETTSEKENEEIEEELTQIEVSLNALEGLFKSRTMKLIGVVLSLGG